MVVVIIIIVIYNIITEGPMRTKVDPDKVQKWTTMTMITFRIPKNQNFSRPLQQLSHTQEVSTQFRFFIRLPYLLESLAMILALMDSVSTVGFHFGKGSKIPGVTLLPRHEDFSPKAA